MTRALSFDQAVLAEVNLLRGFAKKLTRNADAADDLVQETLLRAFDRSEQFQPGTNLGAWLTVICRNLFLGKRRKAFREVEDVDGQIAGAVPAPENQIDHLQLLDVNRQIRLLPKEWREALAVIVGGSSYEEAAALLSAEVGTVKSRVSRARAALSGEAFDENDALETDKSSDLEIASLYRSGASARQILEQMDGVDIATVMRVIMKTNGPSASREPSIKEQQDG